MIRISNLVGLIFAACLGFAVTANAQSYPEAGKPINLLFTFGLGSDLEAMTRLAAEEAGKELGTTIVLENRAGGGGLIGLRALASAAPDGYTIALAGTSNLVVPPLVNANYPDFLKDIVPIVGTWNSKAALLASSKSPFKDLKELIAYAKEHPGKVKYVQIGVGSSTDLLFALFQQTADIKFVPVPYTGIAAALPDLFSGAVDLLITAGTGRQYIQTGELTGIATISNKKSATFFPTLPTIGEAGLPALQYNGASYGIIAPPGTASEIVEKLNAAFNKALASQKVKTVSDPSGMSTMGGSPGDIRSTFQRERQYWKEIVEKSETKK